MVKVSQIERNSIADELGITAGTELLTVNGRPLADFLDWEFLTADEELVIEARQPTVRRSSTSWSVSMANRSASPSSRRRFGAVPIGASSASSRACRPG